MYVWAVNINKLEQNTTLLSAPDCLDLSQYTHGRGFME